MTTHVIDATTSPLDRSRAAGPLLVEPRGGVGDAPAWVARNRAGLRATLREHAALVLRGFGVPDLRAFEAVTGPLVDEWMDYRDRASKRSPLTGHVMTSTDTPPAFTIHPHCESSFTARWPRHIFFHCEIAAASGGRTPVTEVRAVTRDIDSAIHARFEREGVMYVRHFGSAVGFDWRDVFQVSDRAGLERYCRETAIEFEWLEGDRLRTWQVRPAIARHPETGEALWFNHVLALHATSLDDRLRTGILRQVGEAGLPHDTRFGSGDPIGDDVIAHIRDAHARNTVRFDWHPGDVLLLDNMLAAHGREPYTGARRVTTLMADPWSWAAAGVTLAVPAALPALRGPGEAAVAPDRGTSREVAVAPDRGTSREALAAWLASAIAKELELERVDLGASLQDQGGDSLVAVALADGLVKEFGVDVQLDLLLGAESIDAVVGAIVARHPQAS